MVACETGLLGVDEGAGDNDEDKVIIEEGELLLDVVLIDGAIR
jgi:hypothetical protein